MLVELPCEEIHFFQTYGTSSAPFLAVKFLDQLAQDHQHEQQKSYNQWSRQRFNSTLIEKSQKSIVYRTTIAYRRVRTVSNDKFCRTDVTYLWSVAKGASAILDSVLRILATRSRLGYGRRTSEAMASCKFLGKHCWLRHAEYAGRRVAKFWPAVKGTFVAARPKKSELNKI